MIEAPPIYFVQIEELRSGRVVYANMSEGRLAPLLCETGEIGAKVVASDSRRYWQKSKAEEAAHG